MIVGHFRRSRTCKNSLDLRKLVHQPLFHLLLHCQRLGQSRSGDPKCLYGKVTFIQVWNEFTAHLRCENTSCYHGHRCHNQNRFTPLKSQCQERFVQALCPQHQRSEEHTSELQSLMRITYAVFCLKKKQQTKTKITSVNHTN